MVEKLKAAGHEGIFSSFLSSDIYTDNDKVIEFKPYKHKYGWDLMYESFLQSILHLFSNGHLYSLLITTKPAERR
jgi:hypothetical protein